MLKRLLFLSCVLLSGIMTMWAQTETTYSPTLEVNFRTAAGNTAWQAGFPKDAASDGNATFEGNYFAGLFALQKYTIPNLQDVTKLVLTLYAGSGTDAIRVWSFPNNSWTAATSVDDMVNWATQAVGFAPRATEGDANTPLVTKGTWGSNELSPRPATFTISGTALATLKANAGSDGTFTLMFTDGALTSNSSRRYLSTNSANAEANRPTLVATTTASTAKTAKIGDTEYETLADAFAAAMAADADTEIEVSGDQKLTARLTWSKAHTLTIKPTKDITIKGPKNTMWFLVNTNNATLNIGSTSHKITLDGISDDRSSFTNVDVARRENNTQLNLTNMEFKDFNCGDNHLVSCKNSGGAITLQNITMTNSSSTHALIDNQRVANDALILKGYLNIGNDCNGLHINNVANLKGDGTVEGRIKVADENFTASKVITIKWVSSDAAKDVFVANSSVVVGVTSTAIANCFALAEAPEGWTLTRVNNDLKLTAPATPTAKIGDTEYADLAAALGDVADGDVITLLDDQEISSRINVQNKSITITGGKTIKRATGYKGIMFLTVNPASGEKAATITLDGVTIDGQNVEATSPVAEVSNKGTTILKNVVLQNCKNVKEDGTQTSIIVNKGSGKLVLDGVTFTDCTARDGMVFVGTNNVTVKGNVTIPAINIEGDYAIQEDEASAAAKITLNISSSRHYGLLVGLGKESNYDCTTSARLSAHATGIYLMPAEQANSYSHPALLHTAADISAASGRLESEPYKSAYNRLETQSGGTAVGAVEYLKRLDEANWGPSGSHGQNSDFNNYTKAANDARLAYQLALRYQLKGSTAAANAAVAILNNWASTCKGIYSVSGYDDNIPDPNEYLINIQGHQFANAAELLRSYSGWNASDFQNFQTWMKQTFAENAIIFLEKRVGTHYWANWDLAALTSLLSVGILCDDKALVDYAINYTANGAGMGSAAHATTATHSDDSGETLAQCQESGRDQGHSTLDVSLLGVLCQTAANAGAGDLFTSYNALEMAEYVAKYNLKDAEGNFVYSTIPFTSYTNGEYSHDAISADGRGSERNCWELFHAYAKTNAKADKYTEAWVKYFRQKNAYGEGEASTLDELGFGTLMFGAEVSSTDGIQTLKVQQGTDDGIFYNLQGQRVDNPTKGLYIVNGKKVVVK